MIIEFTIRETKSNYIMYEHDTVIMNIQTNFLLAYLCEIRVTIRIIIIEHQINKIRPNIDHTNSIASMKGI